MKRAGKCVNKKAYSHKSKALVAARNSYLNRGVKTTIYECPTCLDFHLTSIPKVTYNTEKYFNKWNKEWMKQKYGEFLYLEGQVAHKLRLHNAPLELEKRQAKRKRYAANRARRIASGELVINKPEKKKVTTRKMNMLSIKEQKAFFASFDSKIYPQPKSFWSRILGIISRSRQ